MKRPFSYTTLFVSLSVVLLSLAGIITIAVGCQNSAEPFALVQKQFLRLLLGIAVMGITANIPFEKIKKSAPYLIGFFLTAMYAVLWFGVKINGMRGWYKFGGTSFQPSEPGKVFFLLGLVLLLTRKNLFKTSNSSSDTKKILLCGAYTAVWLAALVLQPDLGTSTVYCATLLAVLFLGRIKKRCLAALFSIGIFSAAFFVMSHPYAMRRINGFLNPETDPLGSNWHLNQLLRAVSRGAWTGVKSSNAHWSKSYLPFSYNDSVFASVCESIGAVGAVFIPIAFLLIFYLLSKETEKRELDSERGLFIQGAAFMLVFQSFLHISVNLGLAPVTGITMPFVSYGGSSMISGCLLLGTVFSAMRNTDSI